jgi:purine-binding chemotaxis protein CheW
VAENTVLEQEEQMVVFQLGPESYGIDIFRVNEIIRLREITPIPKSEDYIRGLVNLRGKTIPVVDLRIKLNLGSAEDTETTRIIVVDAEFGNIGVVVDAVREVITLQPDQVNQAPLLVSDTDNDFVRGVAKVDDGLITLLHLDQALAA